MSPGKLFPGCEVDGCEQLSTLTTHAQNREVTVFVPACDITLKTVTLPGKYNRQVITALPYMVEEDLAQDVEKLFFAIGAKTTVNDKPAVEVAVVDRLLLQGWLQWLADAAIHATVMLPDALCLPEHPGQLGAIELNQHWLVRPQGWQCASIDNSWVADYLNLSAMQHLNGQVGDERTPLVFNTYSPYALADVPVEGLEIVEQNAEMPLPLELLIKNQPANGFNLLQGEFSQKKEGSKSWTIWRQAAVVAGVAIILQLTYRGSVAWQLGSELDSEKATFVRQYKKAFPNERRVRTALVERQLKTKLKAVRGSSSGDNGFLVMLNKVAPLFKQAPGFVPNSIKFDNKRSELRLQATGDGFQSFEKFKSAVEELGYEVNQGSLNNDGDKVVGAITIKRVG
ncbi:MAG: general secretion pathway protein L [Alteromonadaceae bacterium]